jgi:hypothetical protein
LIWDSRRRRFTNPSRHVIRRSGLTGGRITLECGKGYVERGYHPEKKAKRFACRH